MISTNDDSLGTCQGYERTIPTHPHRSLDCDRVTSTEVGVYGKRSWCGVTVSQTSPATLSHEPLELRSPGTPPPPPCSLPLWSAQELPTGTSFAEETVRDAWNQTEACSNPVIKILHWMLILWNKPNDFAACLISNSDEKPKSIQQNGSTLYTMRAAGRKVHQCGGAAREKKKWREGVLYYKVRHWSQIFALCWVWKLHTAAKWGRLW